MLADLDCSQAGDVDEWFTIEGPHSQPPLVDLVMAGEERTRSVDFMEAAIISRLNRLILDWDAARLHLHAAAVGFDGVGVVLAARSGTGKSTTTAALALEKWTYLSDESVALDAGSASLSGVPKPISLTPEGIDVLRKMELQPAAGWPTISNRAGTHKVLCAASALGARISDSLDCGVVAVLNRADGAVGPPSSSDISAADATVRLLTLTQDFDRFGSGGLETLASLCAASRCVNLSIGAVDKISDFLRELIDQRPPTGDPEVRSVDFANTQTVFVQSEAVVMNRTTSTALSLPPATAELWRDEVAGNLNRHGVADKLTELGILEPSAESQKAT